MTQLTHIQPADLGEADQALKTKHRAVWASGNYAAVVTDIVSELGPILVEAAGIKPGDLVLDVAAGTGNAAIPAARTGAQVIASDLTPELMEVGKKWAADVGVQLTWETADAEALPYGDSEFDAVLSCLGVMFAPHHQAAADELVRVCRPGGTIGLIAWTPAGIHRPDVRHHEAVRSTAASWSPTAAAVGRRRSCTRATRRSSRAGAD